MRAGALTIGIVAGETSGERLALDLIEAISRESGRHVRLVGVGGESLQQRGLDSVFDPREIAITGISAVLAGLPRLLLRIHQTASRFIREKPDVIVLVDSPDFSHRVAQRVKRALPDTPIIKYVAPTVWAWRPDRARKIAEFIDEVLAILPFEPEVMESLGGPKTHYVGHPLAVDPDLKAVWQRRGKRPDVADRKLDLLVLPGSRHGELRALLPDFGETVAILHERGHDLRVHIPTLPHLHAELKRQTAGWRVTPNITVDPRDKLEAFAAADAALAASGTVLLELAMAGVPSISCYRLDWAMRLAVSMITTWSAALPNIIADRPVIPEYINEMIRPGMLARRIEEIAEPGSLAAAAQISGFEKVRELMAVDEEPGMKSARIVLEAVGATADRDSKTAAGQRPF